MRNYGLFLGILGVWRITHLLNAEDGPFDLFVRLRQKAGHRFWGTLLDCFYCLSLWVAIPFAVAIAGNLKESVLLWLALSGGAVLLERVTSEHRGGLSAPSWEEPEVQNGMLREETRPSDNGAEGSGYPEPKDRASAQQ